MTQCAPGHQTEQAARDEAVAGAVCERIVDAPADFADIGFSPARHARLDHVDFERRVGHPIDHAPDLVALGVDDPDGVAVVRDDTELIEGTRHALPTRTGRGRQAGDTASGNPQQTHGHSYFVGSEPDAIDRDHTGPTPSTTIMFVLDALWRMLLGSAYSADAHHAFARSRLSNRNTTNRLDRKSTRLNSSH